MKKLAPLFALPLALFVLCGEPAAAQTMNSMNTPAAPAAKKVPKETKIHGETIVDPYFWMREKTSPEVVSYLEAENAYADAYMKPTAALQEKLYKEMLGRIKQTDTQVPYRENGYLYYTRTVEGKQYPIFARRKGSMDAPEEVTLDVNELAVGHKYTGIGAYAVSDDGNLLAYSVDHDGHRDYKLHVKDLRTGKELPDSLGVVVYVFWAPDSKTLFYGTEDAAKRPHKLWRHAIGDAKEKDALVAEEKDELFRLYAGRTRDGRYVMVISDSSDTSEVSYVQTSN
jgi:oligopeptidase B